MATDEPRPTFRIGAAIGLCLGLTAAVCIGAAQIWDEAYQEREGALIGEMPLALLTIGVLVALVAGVGIGLRRPLVCAATAIGCGVLAFLMLSSDSAHLMNTSSGALTFSIAIVATPLAGALLAHGVLRTVDRASGRSPQG